MMLKTGSLIGGRIAARKSAPLRLFGSSSGAPSSFLLDISADHVSTSLCRNQSELARVLKPKLRTEAAFAAFESVDRALFLPTDYGEPYANEPQQLEHGSTMSTPVHHALVLSTLTEHGVLQAAETVLDVGCGTGYLTAAFHQIVSSFHGDKARVLGTERIPSLVEFGNRALRGCPVTKAGAEAGKVELRSADSPDTFKGYNTFDLIHVGFTFNSNSQDDMFILNKLLGMLSSNPSAQILCGHDVDLCLMTKSSKTVIARLPGMAKMQHGEYQKPLTRQERADQAKKALEDWKADFEKKHGKKPSKQDLFGDRIASALFKEFANATKLV